MAITLNATAVSPAVIKLYAVGFYDKSLGQLSNIETIRSKIDSTSSDPKNGFLLVYASSDCNNQAGGCYVDSSGHAFEAGKTYVYKLNQCTNQVDWLYATFPVSAGARKMTLYKGFDSKSMFTAGFAADNNTPSLSTYQAEINPQ